MERQENNEVNGEVNRMKKALQGVVQEITHSLVLEMESRPHGKRSASVSIIDLLLQQLTKEVVKQLKEANAGKGLSDEDVEAKLEKVAREPKEAKTDKELSDENVLAKLQKVESKLEKRGITVEDDDNDEDEDEVAGNGSSFPNLKYAKPKYKNVESILRYIESDEDKGGVKLVIMNFND